MNTKHIPNAFLNIIPNPKGEEPHRTRHAMRVFCTAFALIAGVLYAHDQTHADYIYATNATAPTTADISTQPISSASSSTVKPNIMLTLDDSGSMDSGYMPDNASDLKNLVSYRFWGCNTIYYNPATSYSAPKNYDGTDFPDVDGTVSAIKFTAAPSNGFGDYRTNSLLSSSSTSSLTNLSTSYKADGGGTETASSAYYFLYNGTQPMYNNGTTYYNSGDPPAFCSSAPTLPTYLVSLTVAGTQNVKYNAPPTGSGCSNGATSSPYTMSCTSTTSTNVSAKFPIACTYASGTGTNATYNCKVTTGTDANGNKTVTSTDGNWTVVIVTTSSPTAIQSNFANWYSYYRERLMMAKAAAGIAFSDLNQTYRVGFITINPNSTVTRCTPGSPSSSCKYLYITDFDSTQKKDWYKVLYQQSTNGSTPLPTALERVGNIYAGKLNSSSYSTSGIPTSDDPVQYSCQQNFTILTTDGYWNSAASTAVHNTDGDITKTPRPMYDGATTGTQTKYTIYTFAAYTQSGKSYWGYYTQNVTATAINGTTTNSYSCGSAGSTSGCTQTKPSTAVLSSNALTYSGTSTTAGSIKASTTTLISSVTCATFASNTCTTTLTSGPTTVTQGGSYNSLSDIANYYWMTDLRNGTTGSTDCKSGSNGNDVCKNNVPVASNSSAEDDNANWQHMTTFTMGFGVFGSLLFESNYQTDTSATSTFNQLRNGTLNWSIPVGCSVDSPTCSGDSDSPYQADDLWHAAVDGRGLAFSATNPQEVSHDLTTAFSKIEQRLAAAAASSTSTLQPVSGDNFAYTANYTTGAWTGELEAQLIDPATGSISATAIWTAQSKLDSLAKSACDNRTIYLYRSGATNNLVNFTWNTYACNSSGAATGSPSTVLNSTEQAWFGASKIAQLSQYADMTDGTSSTVDQRTPAAGANLVNFLRGQSGHENFTSGIADLFYRTRTHILGDIAHSQPAYVRHAIASYTDAGYSSSDATHPTAFVTAQTDRAPMVYVGANDGMLHAFYSGTITEDANGTVTDISSNAGTEAWTFIPSFVAPNMWRLADDNYAKLHQYYVDGVITTSDVCDSANSSGQCTGSWHTILVSGTGYGGKGFFALDVTDPANPKALWQFAYATGIACFNGTTATEAQGGDCNIGYSYGNPQIVKLSTTDTAYPGRWVVLVTSGYNNVISDGSTNDGKGFLYVLDAMTGKILKKIGTGVGSATKPSNLGKIGTWVNQASTNNTAQRVYGADMLGNVWRFDVNGAARLGSAAILVATVKDKNGYPQPITIKPELTTVGSSSVPYVYVATGSYLGPSDLTSTQQQTIYALADNIAAATNAAASGPSALTGVNPRTVLKQVLLTNMDPPDPNGNNNDWRTTTVDCSGTNCTTNTNNGWFVDLPDGVDGSETGYGSERVSVDLILERGTLVIPSNVPGNNACDVGGYGWVNYLNYATGEVVVTADGLAAQKIEGALIVGASLVITSSGNAVGAITKSIGGPPETLGLATGGDGVSGKRVGWRVIQSD